MSEPLPQALRDLDRAMLRAFLEIYMTHEELKLSVGALHEKILGEDSDKVIGELNHRIKQRVQSELLRIERTNPSFASWLDNLKRPGDEAPPQS